MLMESAQRLLAGVPPALVLGMMVVLRGGVCNAQADDARNATLSGSGCLGNGLYDVVVVGAGVSGLAAAREVHRAGRKVVVLEAAGYVGGRLRTVNVGGLPQDAGAAWIHEVGRGNGAARNPVAKLANELGVSFVQVDDDDVLFDAGTQKPAQNWRKYWSDFNAFDKYLQGSVGGSKPDMSVMNVLQMYLKTSQGRKLTQVEVQWLWTLVSSAYSGEYAADLDNLSAKHQANGGYSGNDAIFPGGYSQIADGLASGLCIKTGQVVVNIDHRTSTVKVRTEAGLVYEAPKVVVTVPLGYLKKHHQQLFTPTLSADKIEGMNGLIMGVLDKAIMVWDNPWWERFLDEPWAIRGVEDKAAPWTLFYNLYATPAKLACLVGFNHGSSAIQSEKLTDAQIKDEALRALATMVPAGTTIPTPKEIFVTRWHQYEWTLGSYSAVLPGAGKWTHWELRQPVSNRLFFAGEHTHSSLASTVHGAYLSGIRAAGEVLGK